LTELTNGEGNDNGDGEICKIESKQYLLLSPFPDFNYPIRHYYFPFLDF